MEFLRRFFEDGPLGFDALAEQLKQAGIKLADLAEGGYVSADKFRTMEQKRNALREQLDALEKTGSVAESGETLKARIQELEAALVQREEAHKAQVARMRYEDALALGIRTRGGRSERAVRALLDEDGLCSADDPAGAVEAALTGLAENEPWLFEQAAVPPPPYAAGTGTAQAAPNALRSALGV